MKTQLAGLRAATQTCGGCQGTRGPAVPNVNTTDRRHARSKGHGRKEPRGGNDPEKNQRGWKPWRRNRDHEGTQPQPGKAGGGGRGWQGRIQTALCPRVTLPRRLHASQQEASRQGSRVQAAGASLLPPASGVQSRGGRQRDGEGWSRERPQAGITDDV